MNEPSNKGQRLPGQALSRQEVTRLLAACGRGRTGLRAAALIVLCWRGGLRCAEALAVRPLDVEPAGGLVRVRRGKGGLPRTAGLDAKALKVIERWVRRRGTHDPDVPLLCTRTGRAMTSSACRALIKGLAARAGIQRRVHLHGLRHSYAVGAIEAGVPLHAVQAQLGHRNLSTTGRYLAHVSDERLAEYANRGSW